MRDAFKNFALSKITNEEYFRHCVRVLIEQAQRSNKPVSFAVDSTVQMVDADGRRVMDQDILLYDELKSVYSCESWAVSKPQTLCSGAETKNLVQEHIILNKNPAQFRLGLSTVTIQAVQTRS